MCSCTLQHIMLLRLQYLCHLFCQLINICGDLLSRISADNHSHTCLDILRSEFDTNRDTAHFLLREFPSRTLLRIIQLHAQSCFCKRRFDLICLLKYALLLLTDRDDHDLCRGNPRRKYKSAVVTVYHNDRTDHTGRHTPGSLMYILQGIILICKLYAISLCKAVAEVVARTGLQRFSVMHQRLDRIGCLCTGKFFLVCLLPTDNRDRQHFLAKISVHIQHLDGTCLCLFCRCMCGMALLPQKLSGAQKRTGRLLPAHNGAPLVVHTWQITVRVNIICIEITEQCL